MSYPINYPTPQNANVQIFYGSGDPTASNNFISYDWVKPQGASFVWFTLIGGGGAGDGVNAGGGSGAVTNFMGPAFLMPDQLKIEVGSGGVYPENGQATNVRYQQKDGTGYLLLTANGGGTGGTAGAASTSNNFSAMGFFQSIAGQAGSGAGQSASATTFLSGGGWSNNALSANYGYSLSGVGNNGNGFFMFQPIIVGCGAIDANTTARTGGIGCGGSGQQFGKGGPGLAVIITW